MNRKQTIVLRITVAALLVLWIFPPWHHVSHAARPSRIQPYHEFGFYFLFDTTQGEPDTWVLNGLITHSIAWGQLALLTLIIVVAGGFTVTTLKSTNTNR